MAKLQCNFGAIFEENLRISNKSAKNIRGFKIIRF